MICRQAEDRYVRGRQRLASGKVREALSFFRDAVEIRNRLAGRSDDTDGRYRSFYGLCLGLAGVDLREALNECREAARIDRLRPNIWWNLGRVALVVNRRGEAYRAFQQGLKIQPQHAGMLGDIRSLGVRRPPVLSFLPRNSRLNVLLGSMRGRIGGKQPS